ncbi:8515_t:CDS:2 [Paraglomus occultum]|uniref:8515_t:CDS:1 n=1 Tax=Paraglomus occultum TaxID=144539 RepID=A0A9N9B9J4_9GLOM|nr:8515_t:CDS:2 [Paraglomus occultum]
MAQRPMRHSTVLVVIWTIANCYLMLLIKRIQLTMATRDWEIVMQKSVRSFRPTQPHCRPVSRILSKNEALSFSPENLFDVADTYMLSCFICTQSKHPDDTPVKTEKERNIKELLQRNNETGKGNLSEMEHISRNVMPLLDATVGLDTECRVHYYGERTLEATADRRNKGRDPFGRARDGYKVDAIIEYQELSWLPTIGCGEVSGGLELRDIWRKAQIVWGLQWSGKKLGRKLRIYALGVPGRLFHLVLVEEVALPSSCNDLVSLQHAYRVMLAFTDRLNITKRQLVARNLERACNVETNQAPEEREMPRIINTPGKKMTS